MSDGIDDSEIPWGKVFLVILALIIFSMALGWAIKGNQFFMYKFFAPKEEAVRRETYEQTKSYRQGSVQRLGTLCQQVAEADDGHKGMINDIIKHEFEEWDINDVPPHLRPCLLTARGKS